MALAKWEELRISGRGIPIVLGNDETVATLADVFGDRWPDKRSVADILAAADQLRHPESLLTQRARENAESNESLRRTIESQPNFPLPEMTVVDAQGVSRKLTPEEARAAFLKGLDGPDRVPETGEWPTETYPSPGLSVTREILTGRPLQKVQIALIPTDDWTTIPAHLRWGGWNACPPPEYHVAALRSWRDRYGVELVGMNSDTMNLRAARAPQTRAEALKLAREQYAYCSDIVDQGAGTLSALAATLMADPWWYFWWD